MKKIIALVLALVLAMGLVACGGGNNGGNDAEYRVAMVTDYGDITDQSFNQTTWEACVAFGKATGVEVKYYKPGTNDTAGRVASVELAIAEGYNVIYCYFAGVNIIKTIQKICYSCLTSPRRAYKSNFLSGFCI